MVSPGSPVPVHAVSLWSLANGWIWWRRHLAFPLYSITVHRGFHKPPLFQLIALVCNRHRRTKWWSLSGRNLSLPGQCPRCTLQKSHVGLRHGSSQCAVPPLQQGCGEVVGQFEQNTLLLENMQGQFEQYTLLMEKLYRQFEHTRERAARMERQTLCAPVWGPSEMRWVRWH